MLHGEFGFCLERDRKPSLSGIIWNLGLCTLVHILEGVGVGGQQGGWCLLDTKTVVAGGAGGEDVRLGRVGAEASAVNCFGLEQRKG